MIFPLMLVMIEKIDPNYCLNYIAFIYRAYEAKAMPF